MRVVVGILTSVSLLFFFIGNGQAAPDVSADQAILMDAERGDVLFEKQASFFLSNF